MIKIENIAVYGWEAAIRGMRNPMNSWDMSDSLDLDTDDPSLGPNDFKLAMRLAKAGPEHRKFLRMIHVTMDVVAPLYWWKEYDTYKVGTVANSCSTMHKIHSKEFELDDFSHDQMVAGSEDLMEVVVHVLNGSRKKYLETKDKKWWWQMIQLLPSSYNQRRTLDLNYETAMTIIRQRTGHKLDEWHDMVDTLKNLPYMEDLLNG